MLELRPNCGGGFASRPIRPSVEWRKGVSLGNQSASTRRRHFTGDREALAEHVKKIRDIPPADR
jgi:hypothetical protein